MGYHYTTITMFGVAEPLSLPWHGSVLPLHYCDLVEAPGLEPGPDSLQESRSRQLSYTPKKICWSRWEDSNPQRSVYKTAALPN